MLLTAALGFGLGVYLLDVSSSQADDPKMVRPQRGDRFVFPYGDRQGQFVRPDDLPLGGPPQLAYPIDARTQTVRDGSLLNQVVMIRLDPARLSEDTRVGAADGVVAYSAVCTHQGCPVSMWKEQLKTLFCSCHGSQFDPTDHARVVDGPAPRRLPMLPLETVDGVLVAAGGFSGRVGFQPQ